MPSPKLLKLARLVHLYLGVFIAPAILFFAISGVLQTFGLHETNREHPAYRPARWIEAMGELHKHAFINPAAAKPAIPAPERPSAPAVKQGPPPPASGHHRLPMQLFFAVVSAGLLVSTATGLYMTWKFARNRRAMLATLAAGIVVPVALLFV